MEGTVGGVGVGVGTGVCIGAGATFGGAAAIFGGAAVGVALKLLVLGVFTGALGSPAEEGWRTGFGLDCLGGAAVAGFVRFVCEDCVVILGVDGLFKDSTSASSSEKESKEIPEIMKIDQYTTHNRPS